MKKFNSIINHAKIGVFSLLILILLILDKSKINWIITQKITIESKDKIAAIIILFD